MGLDAFLRFYDLRLYNWKNQWGNRLSKFPLMVWKKFYGKKKQKTCKVIKKWFLPCDSVFKLEGYKTALQSTPAARTNIAFEEGECGGSCDADGVIQIDACHTKLAPN